jgi:bis(5'-nucleosyl)-tetraphosphatase (symmetrical)
MRIFIGDIQGCCQELEALLERARFDPATDALEPVGDLVNRGPESLRTLRLLKSLGAKGVLGNHDLHLLRVAAGTRQLSAKDTIGQVLEADDRDELLRWLAAIPFVRAWDDVALVHAGFDPTWKDPIERLAKLDPLSKSRDVEFATHARWCDEHGARPASDDDEPSPRYKPWFEWPRAPALGERTVVFGHWARNGLVVRPKLRGLDTGCVWGGKLTAWIAEEDRLVDVPARRAWAQFAGD